MPSGLDGLGRATGHLDRSADPLQRHLIRSLARRGLDLAAFAPLCGLAGAELRQQLTQLEIQGRNQALDGLRDLQASSAPSQSLMGDDSAKRTSALLSLLGSPLASRPSSCSPLISHPFNNRPTTPAIT